MTSKVDVYLGLGSNQDAKKHIAAGIVALQHRFGDFRISPIYRSRAVGFSGDDFLNAAAWVTTDLKVGELKAWLTDLEDRHGRDRSQPRFSDRSLDIDILLYGDWVGTFDGLELPRGEILKYAHVLKPLADIAPDLKHPVSGLTFAEHWRRFEGDRTVEPLE
jgi:2-amino-4-hydroxy-6-hydroxymethyldihydropteridine diphosphokinase